MAGVYIASTAPRAGKSLLTFSLGVLLQQSGLSVGYMKPLGRLPQKHEELMGDSDALVVQEVLGQNIPADVLTPVMLPQNLHGLAIAGREQEDGENLTRIHNAYRKISEGKDITLVSGAASFPAAGRFAHVDGMRLVRELNLKVLFIERYTGQINFDKLLFLKDMLGEALIGVVLNDVPEREMRDVDNILKPWLEGHGITVHGVLKHEPGLTAMRVSDLAYGLSGRIVAGNAQASRMVNGFLLGTMQVDNFMVHLRNRENCAVIVGGDRADLQLAALHTKAPCIILTGNMVPSELIRTKAEAANVTLIMVREDAYSIARSMSRILRSKKLRDLAQIRLGISLAEKTLDKESILRAAGVVPK
jgi:hypothetical protein